MITKRIIPCLDVRDGRVVKGVNFAELRDVSSPEVLADLSRVFVKDGSSFREIKVLHTSIFKSFVLADLDGINDMDVAAAMKGTTIYADREDFDLEEGDYFIADLIGLDVVDVDDGTKYGVVKDVINRGSADIYVIKTEGGERMMPAVEEFVKRVDIDDGKVYIQPIPGLLSDD